MGRIKKPDPPTQKLILPEVDSEALYLLRRGATHEFTNDGTGNNLPGDFNRMAKADQDKLLSEYLSEVIKRDYINTYGKEWGYDIATKRYQEEQEKSIKHWSMDNE